MSEFDVDAATELSERERMYQAQQAAAKAGQQEVPRTGWCINDCGQPTHGVFCGRDCRDQYNQRERMKR